MIYLIISKIMCGIS